MVVLDIMSARVVCRSRPAIASLPHVYSSMAMFLLPSHKWTLERSIRCGYHHLTALLFPSLEENTTISELEKRGRARKGVHAAARAGDLALMQRLVQSFDCVVDDEAAREAVAGGDLEALKWVYSQLDGSGRDQGVVVPADKLFPTTVELDAVAAGNLDMLQWICAARGFGPSRSSLSCAVKYGHLPLVQWLYAQSPRALESFEVVDVAKGGHLAAIQFLHEKSLLAFSITAVDTAAGNGHVELAQWVYSVSNARCSRVAFDIAAARGDLEAIRWLHKNVNRFQMCSKKTMDAAARDGHLAVIEFLHRHCRAEGFTHAAMDGAAGNNRMDVVMYLHTLHNDGCSPDAMDKAATNGHLEMVKWLHENYSRVGCTTAAMDGAAGNGHLQVVQWLQVHRHAGCTAKAMDAAAANGHLHVIRWLQLNRTEGCMVEAMHGAGRLGRTDILEFLLANRPEVRTPSSVVDESRNVSEEAAVWFRQHMPAGCASWVRSHELLADPKTYNDTARWFVEHVPPGWTDLMSHAAKQSDMELLRVLHKLKHFVGTDGWRAASTAAELGNVEVLQWMLEHYLGEVRGRVVGLRKVASLWRRWFVYEWLGSL